MRCHLCNKKIEETFLGKLLGTIVKINIDGKNRIYYACAECQRKHQDKLKEKVKEK
jgi:hypothetical protein